MAGRSARSRRVSQDSSQLLMRAPDVQRRSLSQSGDDWLTDDTPRHNARMPSVDDIRLKAFPIPVYTAAGDVAKTCIRV